MSAEPHKRFTKRVSAVPTAPKAPTALHPTAVIAQHAILTGAYPITVGARAVIHPYAKIVSFGGPVIIQDGALIWEKAIVGAGSIHDTGKEQGAADANGDRAVKIGKNVVVETGAVIEAEIVDEGTTVEAFARIGEGATIGKHCKITSYAVIPPEATVPDYTVVRGQNIQRTDVTMKQYKLMHDIKVAAHHKTLNGLQSLIASNLAKFQ